MENKIMNKEKGIKKKTTLSADLVLIICNFLVSKTDKWYEITAYATLLVSLLAGWRHAAQR